MRIFQYILVIFFMIFLFYRMGILIKYFLKRKNDNILNILLNGFMLTFAIFEIITLPYNIFKLDITSLYYISIVLFICLILLSFIINLKKLLKKEFKISKLKEKSLLKKTDLIEKIKKANKIKILITISVIFLIIMQIVLSSYLYESNADDSFYVSWSQQAKQLEKYVENDPSTGRENTIFEKGYILNSWETFNGFVARSFNIEVSSLTHTLYIIVLIIISYIAYYLFFEKLDKKNSVLMLFVLSIIFLFSGASTRFRGYTLLMRIWQGKTILVAIFIPYIMKEMIGIKELDFKKIFLLIITNIASMAFNPIAIWFFPFLYFFFAIMMLLKKQIKNMFKMILVIIPYLLILPVFYFIAVNGGEGSIEVTNIVTYMYAIKDFIRNGYGFICLYILSIIYILFKGSKEAKELFIIIPILTFLTLANPLISEYVQRYVTASATYWRIFWLLPIELTISYAVVCLAMNFEKKYIKIILFTIFICLIIVLGKNMYIESGEFSKHVNTEKIPQYIIDETRFLLENSDSKIVVVAPEEPLHGATMRQLSSNIILWHSRPLYLDKLKTDEERNNLQEVYNKIYDGLEIEEVYEIFNNENIDFIIVDITNSEKLTDLDENIAKIVYKDDYYIIIKNVIKINS